MGLRDTLIVETEAAFVILGLLLVFLPMYLSVLARAEANTESSRTRRAVHALAWSIPALILLAGADATLGLLALWGHADDAKPTRAVLLIILTWLVVLLALVAVKLRAA